MYEKGDLALVAGSVCDGKTYKNYQFMVVQVEEVGEFDLFVMPISDAISYLKKPFKISKRSCQKIFLSNISTHAQISKADIGDLVLIYQENYKETIKKIGILMSIATSPGTGTMANVLCAGERVKVRYESLMVIDKKCKS